MQGANVTHNAVAGLVVNGTAEVSISNSSFVKNERAWWHGGALVADGNATVHVAGTIFASNAALWTQHNGGVCAAGRLLTLGAVAHMGLLSADSRASTWLAPQVAAKHSLSICFIPRIMARVCAAGRFLLLLLQRSVSGTIASNTCCTTRCGLPCLLAGAILLNGNARVLVDNCTFNDNWAEEGSGACVYTADTATLVVSNSLFNASVAT